jgi:hypothetical protein
MALGYRTVLTADLTSDNRDSVLTVLNKWVTNKKHFPSMPTNGSVVNPTGAVLTASSFSHDESSGFRWELIEDWTPPPRHNIQTTTGTAIMHITLVSSATKLWFWVDIEPPTLTVLDASGRARVEAQYTSTPAFVSDIIDSVEMQDGRAEPLSGFQMIPKASYVDNLQEVVEDKSRIGAVFVTAPPRDVTVAAWTKQSNDRAHAMQGLFVGYVLAPEALTEFNKRAQHGHFIPPGGMRTFLPGARLNDADDAINHKLMHASTLRDSDEHRVRRILRSSQIQRLRGLRLPDILRDADYEFLRMRRLQPFEVLHTTNENTLTKSTLDVTIEVVDLRGRLATAEQMAMEAFDDNRKLQQERDDALDVAESNRLEAEDFYVRYSLRSRDIEKLENRVDYFRKQLTELGSGAEAWNAPDETTTDEYPATFAELIESITKLKGVRFTGDRDETIELDEHSMLGEGVVTKAWDALLTFDAYSRARQDGVFDHSLSQYITHATHGRLVRIGKVVWSESETVRNNDRFREQRTLPVDIKVDSTGRKLMVAHVKLSNLTGIAPRLYFDDSYSAAGYVTVGYLGSHMDNTLTN